MIWYNADRYGLPLSDCPCEGSALESESPLLSAVPGRAPGQG